ncbi:MAG: glycosyltransferase family 2 protein [Anaerolineae bacterium]|nr:glycosyltransferase family 2 protein [Anaerolineae bacterium]
MINSIASTFQAKLSSEIKFTVLIPTRERCDTLIHTLKTCITQDYDNFEIIVSDNFSHDETRAVVESFGDSRIHYVNTGKRVSMTSNWEFGLSYIKDGYVTIIGDDDGLLPNILVRLNWLIVNLGEEVEAIAWKTAAYGWPTHLNKSERNRLLIPMGNSLSKFNSKKMLAKVAQFKALYSMLPNLYNSFVHSSVIERVTKASGKFFHSVTPDAYAGVVIACATKNYYYSFQPYTVNGMSHHSNGASQLGEIRNLQAYQKYISENDIPFHPQLVQAPSVAILTAEVLLQAKEHLPAAANLDVDIKAAILYAVKVAAIQSSEMYATVVDAIMKIGQLNHFEEYVAEVIAKNPNKPKDNRAIIGYNLLFNTLRIRADIFGVHDIYTACLLCYHVLVLKEQGYHTIPGILRATLKFAVKFFKGGGDHFARTQKRWHFW